MNSLVLEDSPRPGVTVLTLNRPDKRNALNVPLMQALCGAVKRVSEQDGQRVLVFQGAGPAFCSGLDLREAQDSSMSGASGGPRAPHARKRLPLSVRDGRRRPRSRARRGRWADGRLRHRHRVHGHHPGLSRSPAGDGLRPRDDLSAAPAPRTARARAPAAGRVHQRGTRRRNRPHQPGRARRHARRDRGALHQRPAQGAARRHPRNQGPVRCTLASPLSARSQHGPRRSREDARNRRGQEGMRAFLDKRPPAWLD